MQQLLNVFELLSLAFLVWQLKYIWGALDVAYAKGFRGGLAFLWETVTGCFKCTTFWVVLIVTAGNLPLAAQASLLAFIIGTQTINLQA